MARIFFLFILVIAAAVLPHNSARAQQYVPPDAPPVRETIDQNGVDLSRGTLVSRRNSVSIGDADNEGLVFTRAVTANGYFRDNIGGGIVFDGSYLLVTFGENTEVFEQKYPNYVSVNKTGSTLVYGSAYIYTTKEGVEVTYEGGAGYHMYGYGAHITSVKYPTGEVQTYNYRTIGVCHFGAPPCTSFALNERIQSITSSNGYMLKMSFASDTVPQNLSFTEPWFKLIKVTALNASVDYCDPIADSCSFSTTWPSLTIGYTGSRVSSLTDALNNVTSYTYTSSRLTGIKRPGASSNNITISYNGSGYVSSVVNEGVTTNYTYADAAGVRTTTMTNASPGNRVIKIDIANMQVTSDTNELGKETKYAYDPTSRLMTEITAPEGNAVEFEYDPRGNQIKTTLSPKPGSGLLPIVTEATYPAGKVGEEWRCADGIGAARCNKPLSTKDAKGNIAQYEYDNTHGGVIKVTLPAPSGSVNCPSAGVICPETRFSYTSTYYGKYKNSSGALVNFATPLTHLTKISACQTTASCENAADETKSVMSYGTNNVLLTSVAQGSGNGALTATTAYSYNNFGNRTTVDGPLSGTADTTRTRYDLLRRVIGVVGPDPDGGGSLKYRARRLTYNADSQITLAEVGTVNSQSDADWLNFASFQQLTSTFDTATARKSKDVVTASTPPAAPVTYQVMQYSYDSLGRPECQALRMNSATWGSLPSSACGLATTGSQGPDRISRTTYDAVGRISVQQSAYGITTANGFPATLQRNEITNSYTDNGKPASVTDAKGNKTTYEYDGIDRLTKTHYPSPTTAGSSSTTDYAQPTYDANSNVTALRLRDGQSIGFGYDNLNRLTSKNLPGSEPDVTYGYDLLGRQTSASQTGNALSFTYDALNRNLTQVGPLGTVTSIWDVAGRRTRLDLPGSYYTTYDYLVTGEITAVRENGAASGVGVLATFTYDNLGNRTGLTRGNGTTTSYTPDAISRLSSLGQDLAATVSDQTLGFTYNVGSQIVARSSSNDAYAMRQQYNASRGYTVNGLNQYLAAGSVSPTYDGRGNLTGQGTSSYSYSSENLLQSATEGGTTTTLSYDPMTRLYQTSGGTTRRLLYDGMDLVAEYDGSGNVQRRYVHGSGLDEPLVWYEGSGTSDRRWLHADERGSVIAITNDSGAATGINAYDPWGNPQSSNIGRFQFTGQTWLPEIGLYYYKARFYNARLGRFMQTDPIGYQAGMNLYAYVRNDPINAKDPLGLDDAVIVVNAPKACSIPGCDIITDTREIERLIEEFSLRGLQLELTWEVTASKKAKNGCPGVPASRPVGTTGETVTALKDPLGAYAATVAADQARKASTAAYPNLRGKDDAKDAFRHFYWVFAMTKLLGSGPVKLLA